MKNVTVYSEDETFAGWPANHGSWQWGNELLFGFLRGRYRSGAGHRICDPYEKVLARSLDGGETWSIEIPNVDFECISVCEQTPSFTNRELIIRVCGVYDTGGEKCYFGGGFYTSNDRGKIWDGAFPFIGLDNFINENNLQCTSRTSVIPDKDMLLMSFADRFHWGSDRTYCVKWNGSEFSIYSSVCNDLNRAVMPSVACARNGVYFVALRRRNFESRCWIDIFASIDDCNSWNFLSTIDSTGRDNGNPPALIYKDDLLICAYGNRSEKCIYIAISNDVGITWTKHVIKDHGKTDIGYPILFCREDGKIVCIYYWADGGIYNCQRIESTIFDLKELTQ